MVRASTDLGGRCALTNRYRGAAMAEFWRALRTLKALQAEQALQTQQAIETGAAVAAHLPKAAAPSPLAARLQPNEPTALARPQYLPSAPPASGALHRPAAPWRPAEPEQLQSVPCSPEPAAELDGTSDRAQRAPTSDPRTSRRS